MKSRWLSAAFLAVALAVSACGGAEPGEGDVHAQLLDCDEEGQCPTGYYCDPGWVCRRGVGLTSQSSRGTPDSNSLGGTCQENCAMQCNDLYPEDSNLRSMCTTSCIIESCGGADYPSPTELREGPVMAPAGGTVTQQYIPTCSDIFSNCYPEMGPDYTWKCVCE